MKKITKLTSLTTVLIFSLLFSTLISSQSLKAQTSSSQNDAEDSLYAVRLTLGWNNMTPGGMGIRLATMFDINRVNISQGLRIYPAVGLAVNWGVDIDDPIIKHMVTGGLEAQVRFAVDLTRRSWSTTVETIPWIGFSLGGCYSVTQTRGSEDDGERAFTENSSGSQFCYGPNIGLDVEIGRTMVVGVGIQTTFFSFGKSGYVKSPFYTLGGNLSIGTKLAL